MNGPRLVVDAAALRANLETARRTAGVPVWCVLKGNAYGMGLREAAGILAAAGADRFAVTEPEEARVLRETGFAGRILLMRETALPDELAAAAEAGAELTAGSVETVKLLQEICAGRGLTAAVHAEADAGMGRSGFHPGEYAEAAAALAACANLRVAGVMGHPNRAFSDAKYTREAVRRVDALADALRAAGVDPGERHAADSVAAFRFPWARLDAVRVGSALTGALIRGDRSGLSRVTHAECPVSAVRRLLPGETAGYGFAFTAKRKMTVAVIPMGYADGAFVFRAKDNRARRDALRLAVRALQRPKWTVRIRGAECPVLGYVGMKHLLVCADGTECRPGDAACVPVDPLIAGGLLPHEVR